MATQRKEPEKKKEAPPVEVEAVPVKKTKPRKTPPPIDPDVKPEGIDQDVWDRTPPQFRKTLWQPGRSGNPGGRTRRDPVAIATLHKAAPIAAKALLDVLDDPKAQQRDKIRAAEIVFERLYGKAVQPIDADINGGAGVLLVQLQGKLAEWGE